MAGLLIIFGAGIVIAVSIAWLDHRTRTKALDILRAYAQRGEEPPASIVEAVAAVASGSRPGPRPGAACVPTRADHVAYVAAWTVAALGSAGMAWWRIPHNGEPGTLALVAVFAAVLFTMSAAARLVSVFSAPRPVLENDMSHVAANVIGVAGTFGIAWWQMPNDGEPRKLVIWTLIVGIFLAAMLARSLVRVFTAPGSDRSRDDR